MSLSIFSYKATALEQNVASPCCLPTRKVQMELLVRVCGDGMLVMQGDEISEGLITATVPAHLHCRLAGYYTYSTRIL